MLNTTNNNSEYLHSYITKIAKKEIATTDTSGVYTGTVVASYPGYYEIALNQSNNNSNVYAVTMNSADSYEKNDCVYLLKAEMSTNINYFIFGKVDAVQETFFNLTDEERFMEDSKLLDTGFTFGTGTTVTLPSNNLDRNNVETICSRIKALGYFQIEVEFTSGLGEDDYLEISLRGDGAAEKEIFTLRRHELEGQPWKTNYHNVRKKVFHLTKNFIFNKIQIKKSSNSFSLGKVNIIAGSLLEVTAAYQNNIAIENNKNYFEKGVNEFGLNQIKLTSNLYYNNQPLIGNTVQYYWLLKDDTATDATADDYLPLDGAGNGWRCLNDFQWVDTADGSKIRIWDNKNNFITLDKTNHFVTNSNFVNEVKCLVKYFDNFISSDKIEIFNYDNEKFSASLSANVDPIVIINKEDIILLECEVTNNNNKIDLNDYFIKYTWYLGEAPENIKALSRMRPIPNLSSNKITVVDRLLEDPEESEDNIREMALNIESFFCVATIYHKNDVKEGVVINGAKEASVEISNSIQVTSAAAAMNIKEEEQYKYYIADNSQVSFSKNIDSSESIELSEWSGDWDIYDEEVESPTWTVGDFNKVFNSLNIFDDIENKNHEYFIYYTKRVLLTQDGKLLRKENGSFPQIARSVFYNDGWKNFRTENEITQLNTFNQLTNNGKDDGIYYSDMGKITKDDSPKPEKTYYQRNEDGTYSPLTLNITWDFYRDDKNVIEADRYYVYDESSKKYISIEAGEFDDNITYYGKSQTEDNVYYKLEKEIANFNAKETNWPDPKPNHVYEDINNKLLINASYIRSGTLEIKDKFYASIDNDDVRIGGYSVNKTELTSGTVGISSDNGKDTNVAFWAGSEDKVNAPFRVYYNGDAVVRGKIFAEGLEISKDVAEEAGITTLDVMDAQFNELKGNIASLDSKINNGAYFAVDQDITDGKGKLTPAIILATDSPAKTDLLYLKSNNLILNSGHLKLNHDGEEYQDGYFAIDTDNFKVNTDGQGSVTVTGTINATSLNIGESQQSFDTIQENINKNIKEATDIADAAQTKVDTLDQAIKDTTYFGVDTENNWIYLKSKKENPKSPGLIYLNSDSLVINSDNLKFNTKGDGALEVAGKIHATALTIDGSIGGANLAANKYLSIYSTNSSSSYAGYKFFLSLGSSYSSIGVQFNEQMFKIGSKYVLSFKYREVDSNKNPVTGKIKAQSVGGHSDGFTTNRIVYISSNGTKQSYTDKYWYSPPMLGEDFVGEIEVQVYLTFNGNKNDNKLYIQPGRSSSDDGYGSAVYCEIWDVKVEEGTIATGWSPANEDNETFFKVDPSTGNIVLKAEKTLSLSGDEIEITSDHFGLTKEGEISATKGNIGGFHISSDHLADGTANDSGDTSGHQVMLSPGSSDNDFIFWAGTRSDSTDESRPFWVKKDGRFQATSAMITGELIVQQKIDKEKIQTISLNDYKPNDGRVKGITVRMESDDVQESLTLGSNQLEFLGNSKNTSKYNSRVTGYVGIEEQRSLGEISKSDQFFSIQVYEYNNSTDTNAKGILSSTSGTGWYIGDKSDKHDQWHHIPGVYYHRYVASNYKDSTGTTIFEDETAIAIGFEKAYLIKQNKNTKKITSCTLINGFPGHKMHTIYGVSAHPLIHFTLGDNNENAADCGKAIIGTRIEDFSGTTIKETYIQGPIATICSDYGEETCHGVNIIIFGA